KPRVLRRAWAAADDRAVAVEDDDVPTPDVGAVPALPRCPRARPEIAEVARPARGVEVVVSGGRQERAVLERSPGRVVAGLELPRGAILVGVAAGREHGARDRLHERSRRGRRRPPDGP